MASRVISAVLKFKDQNFATGLRNANRQAGDFGRHVQVVQNNVENLSRKAKTAFKSIGVAAGAMGGAAVAALGAAVASSVVEMDSAFSKLEAQTGASGAKLAEYKDVAKDVFKNGFGENITEASTAVGKLANMFKDVEGADLSKVAQGSFTIAKTFDQEATEVGRAVKTLRTNFTELSDTDATDLITVAFQKTGDYANDVLDTFSEYSGYFKDIGMSGEKFTNMLVKGAQSGAWNIDKVGDAVKEFTIRSIDGSKGTNAAFKTIGLNADDMASKFAQGGDTANNAYMATIAGLANMKDELKRNEAGVALFGTMWEDLRDDVVLSMSDSTDALGDYKGATDKAATALNSGPIARIKNAWRELVTDLASGSSEGAGKNFMDGLADAAENAVPAILDLADKAMSFATTIKDNWPVIRETMIGITVALVTFKAGMVAMKIVSTVTGFIKAYRAAVVAGTTAQWLLNTALAANPIGIVIGVVAALAAGIVLLYRNSEKFRNGWDSVWGGVKRVAASAVNGVIEEINRLIKTINKIPGVNIPIIPKVEWGNVASAGSKEVHKASSGVNKGPVASYAVGSNRISHDQFANIHKDEMIIPARQAANIRAQGGNIDNIDKLVSQQKQVAITTSSEGKTGNTFSFGNIIIQGVEGTTAVVNEFVREVKLQLANM